MGALSGRRLTPSCTRIAHILSTRGAPAVDKFFFLRATCCQITSSSLVQKFLRPFQVDEPPARSYYADRGAVGNSPTITSENSRSHTEIFEVIHPK